ncbi:MAG: hypothetical protein ACO3L1_04195 [Flavobacteriaceae bacterium]
MARIVVFFLALCLWFSGYTQFSATQVSWDTQWEKIEDSRYRLIFNATIEEGWHIFSQYSPEGGSQPAFFEFIESDAYKRLGPVMEPTPEAYYNDVFEVTEQIFSNEVRFEQVVEIYDLSKSRCITRYVKSYAFQQVKILFSKLNRLLVLLPLKIWWKLRMEKNWHLILNSTLRTNIILSVLGLKTGP